MNYFLNRQELEANRQGTIGCPRHRPMALPSEAPLPVALVTMRGTTEGFCDHCEWKWSAQVEAAMWDWTRHKIKKERKGCRGADLRWLGLEREREREDRWRYRSHLEGARGDASPPLAPERG